jgi:hypothetical protein
MSRPTPTRARSSGAGAGQLREIGGAADFLHRLVGVEQRLQRDRVGDHVLVGGAQDGVVDAAVQRLEEMFGPELELDVLDQPVVDHQRAQQRGLRLDVAGQLVGFARGRFRAVGDTIHFGHGDAPMRIGARTPTRTNPARLWISCERKHGGVGRTAAFRRPRHSTENSGGELKRGRWPFSPSP